MHLEGAAYASSAPREQLHQLLAVKDAFQNLKTSATFLPPARSVLPALLAARSIQSNIQGSKDVIASADIQVTQMEARLQAEEANLRDANLLTQAMEDRVRRLRAQHQDRSQKTPAQIARELIATKHAQKETYDTRMQVLGDAMNDFINDYLSSMLAAEELGGPVVGDMLDVEDGTLAAGFTRKGRAKSTKRPVVEKSRQRKIDQIWGRNATATVGDEQEPPTEAEAADAEMRELIGNLFATLTGPGGGKAYHSLARESAASRFLVRAKVAQFHPKDAKKLRLVDFGKELDD